ncbi:MAG TPA: Ldh family oxidoreductase [Chloroflexota bacterium]|nr:Ldh family oxidoreductase [Chloroflexota bacterium]
MPLFSVHRLETLAASLLEAAGAPDDIARTTAGAIVGADIAGHESHGVAQLPGYLEGVRAGRIVPSARPEVVQQRGAAVLLDAQKGLGHYSATVAMEQAIQRAREHHLGAASLANANHIGRLGTYAEQAAQSGYIGVVALGVGGTSGTTAPFGGTRGALGSNPIAAAVPLAGRPPYIMDMATSVLSNGKIGIARREGHSLPPGAILDKEGRPSTDPADWAAGGPMLPAGGYKGYALSLLNLFLAALSMTGMPAGDRISGTFFLAVDIAAFQPLEEYTARTSAYVEQLKAVSPQEGVAEILLPGERAARTAAARREHGVPVPDDVWTSLQQAGAALGIPVSA